MPVLAYLGPSVAHDRAQSLLPIALLRPPIRRGDLYRDRSLGGTVFLIVDGVFMHQQAVPPREIIDVIEDGALVIGAASLGALRAAECWPAGMLGVGMIYRLFRQGCLDSDDEVAVAFDPENANRTSSLALVNVRVAVRKALRAGLLEPKLASRIVDTAKDMFFPQRSWQGILGNAGIHERTLVDLLCSTDVKRDDAERALRRVTRWIQSDRRFLERPRRMRRAFVTSEESRERPHDALFGQSLRDLRKPFIEWLLLSGRFHRYAQSGLGTRTLTEQLRALQQRPARTASLLLKELAAQEATDHELFAWRALQIAVERARSEGAALGGWQLLNAELRLATAHGASSWSELLATIGNSRETKAALLRHRDTLALALAARY